MDKEAKSKWGPVHGDRPPGDAPKPAENKPEKPA